MITVQVQGCPVHFKMDTGAEVTVICEQDFEALKGVKLEPPNLTLYGPAHQALDVFGQCKVTLFTGQNVSTEDVYVIHHLKTSLLGLSSIIALKLITTPPTSTSRIKERLPTLFTGLGTFREEYQIKLQEGVKPHVHSPQ